MARIVQRSLSVPNSNRLEEVIVKLEELSPEVKEKLKACKTTEELLAALKDEGVELDDEQLEALSGGREHLCFGLDDCGAYVYYD